MTSCILQRWPAPLSLEGGRGGGGGGYRERRAKSGRKRPRPRWKYCERESGRETRGRPIGWLVWPLPDLRDGGLFFVWFRQTERRTISFKRSERQLKGHWREARPVILRVVVIVFVASPFLALVAVLPVPARTTASEEAEKRTGTLF